MPAIAEDFGALNRESIEVPFWLILDASEAFTSALFPRFSRRKVCGRSLVQLRQIHGIEILVDFEL